MVRILLLMILLHIIDDFVLQPVSLSQLKQKEWWRNCEGYDDRYKNDYVAALVIHGISWSIMIHLPILFLTAYNPLVILISVFLNAVCHSLTDHFKANLKKINLITDQYIHLLQILCTAGIFIP